jgi:hypothetical protein
MTFESHTYKPNPKKVKEDNMDKLYIAGGIFLFVLVFIFLFRGILGFLILGGMSYTLIHLKISDNKKKGANRFGSLVERLILTQDLLTIGDKQFKIDQLNNFKIDADDFLGMSSDFLGVSTGTDNFIQFTQGGTNYSFQFQVRRSTDLKLLAEISKQLITTSVDKL